MAWTPPKTVTNDVTLNEYDSRDLRIVKQAICKSFIEAGACEFTPELEKEISKFIKFVYRNTQSDKKMTESEPF